MFGSQILEVAIALVFVYLVFSLICSGVKEWVHHLLKIRSKTLEEELWNMFKDKELVKAFYSHQLVEGVAQAGIFKKILGSPEKTAGKNTKKKVIQGDEKLSTQSFSEILLDCVYKSVTEKEVSEDAKKMYNALQKWVGSPGLDSVKKRVKELMAEIEKTGQKIEGEILQTGQKIEEEIKKTRLTLESWFDNTMEKLSAWYRKKTKQLIFVLALILTVMFNVDTIMIIKDLSVNPQVRAAMISQAEKLSATETSQPAAGTGMTTEDFTEQLESLKGQLRGSGLPLGWVLSGDSNKTGKNAAGTQDPRGIPKGWLAWMYKIIGLLISLLAISMGAPFWFRILRKLFDLRKKMSGTGTNSTTETAGNTSTNKPSTTSGLLSQGGQTIKK
ncbi:MAG: hypothetical protein GY940_20680 [bacterium]|nr:hypothetical protein [bacterium]